MNIFGMQNILSFASGFFVIDMFNLSLLACYKLAKI